MINELNQDEIKKIEELINRASTFNNLNIRHREVSDEEIEQKIFWKSEALFKDNENNKFFAIPVTAYEILSQENNMNEKFSDIVKEFPALKETPIMPFSKNLGQSEALYEARGLEWNDLSSEEFSLLKKVYGESIDCDMSYGKSKRKVLITHVQQKPMAEVALEKVADNLGLATMLTGGALTGLGALGVCAISTIGLPVALMVPSLVIGPTVIGVAGITSGVAVSGAGSVLTHVPNLLDKIQSIFDSSEKEAANKILEYKVAHLSNQSELVAYLELDKNKVLRNIDSIRDLAKEPKSDSKNNNVI